MALMRPQQWIKNFFVFAPGFFAFRLGDWAVLGPAFGAFGAFCLASSAIYALNDALDVEADRKHPDKCHRPVASGRLSWREAIGVATAHIPQLVFDLLLLRRELGNHLQGISLPLLKE